MRRRQILAAKQEAQGPGKVIVEMHDNGDVDYHWYPLKSPPPQEPKAPKRKGRPRKQDKDATVE